VPKIGAVPEQVTKPVEVSSVMHQRMDMIVGLVQQSRAEISANHDLLIGEVRTLSGRVGNLEERAQRTSNRVEGESRTNLQQESAIATIVTRVDAIEKKTDAQTAMLTKAAGFLRDPKFIAVAMLAYGIIRSWAAKHGVELP
jgi:hypothetical protein